MKKGRTTQFTNTDKKMAHEYKNEVEAIIANTDFIENQIFDITLSPHVDEFANTFNFYRETLSGAVKYGVHSGYIFFYNDRLPNAKAGISKGHGIIFFNAGLIITLIQSLLEKKEIDDVVKNEYAEFHKLLDNPANNLVYQAAQHFTFYHELGHLIQQSKDLETYLPERSIEPKVFDFTKHKLEIDADSFSAIAIAAHVQQYIFKIFGEDLNNEKVESIIEIFCSGVLLYFLSFDSFKDEMYYEEGTHPHPILRILNVIMIITQYCRESPRIKDKEININHLKILNRTLSLASKLEEKSFGTTKSKTFLETLIKERTEIIEYYKKIRSYIPENFILAEDKWNATVKK